MSISRFDIKSSLSLLILILVALTPAVSAGDHGQRHQGRERRHHGNDHRGDLNLRPVQNAAYAARCGDCHFAYQPELLPTASWEKLLEGTSDHFGEAVDLDEDERLEIRGYLKSNAADKSSAGLAGKIMMCLGSRTPLRISDIPFIRRNHHEISAQVFQRPSVKSLSNCIACHKTAEKGVYDDDQVSIPD